MPIDRALDTVIGARLQKFRKSRLLSRPALARELGVAWNKFVNYELGRTPLPWGVFAELHRRFDLNPAWLVSDSGPETALILNFNAFSDAQDAKAKLSDVMERPLGTERMRLAGPYSETPPIRTCLFNAFNDALTFGFDAENSSETQHEQGRRMLRDFSDLLNKCALPRKPTLDDVPQAAHFRTVLSIPSDVDELLDRVRAATAAPGAKRDLAATLGVKQQQLSKWLSPEGRKPSADYVLALLKWLTGAQASPKKTPPEVETRTARKAKPKSNNEERQKLDPPRS